MSKRSFYILYKQVAPEARKPWRIAETFTHSDGLRTRLTSFCYMSEIEALEQLNTLINEANK